jgi:hypothetical protein
MAAMAERVKKVLTRAMQWYGTMAAMADDLDLTEPWWDLRGAGATEANQRQTLLAELIAEVRPGHPLHGIEATVIARSTAQDDVLVELNTDRWAIVHLTWRGSKETPPWPRTTFYSTPQQLRAALQDEG